MKSEWCEYSKSHPYTHTRGDSFRFGDPKEDRIPRKRMVCPVCKRRLLARICISHDGDAYYAIPRHKSTTNKPRQASRKTGRARIGRGRS